MSEKHTIAQRLREQCSKLRTKPTPLAELIPLMQQAADALEASPAPCAMPVRPSDAVQIIEMLAQQWDGCEFDAPGGLIDIGDAIRRAGLPMALSLSHSAATPSLKGSQGKSSAGAGSAPGDGGLEQ